ncbi:MAG: HdeD family acid-resistance protein [Sulfitobacter sp.]
MKHWVLWLIAGALSLLGGVMALTNPLAASLTAEQLAGWAFIFTGMLSAFSAFGDQGWGARLFSLLLGLVILLIGVNLVAHPLRGLLSLTYAVALFMLVAGMFRLLLAFRPEFAPLRWVMLLSGAVSLGLAAMILGNFPQSAVVVLGLYLGIELISNGISLIAIALTRKTSES